jgi:L-ascorbate metabolism protein UlaG (beta-lactamase superfamily)
MPPARADSADRVTYVGHATVLLELDGLRFLTDPVLRSRVGLLRRQGHVPDREVAEQLDAVLISHLHYDHVDLPSLSRVDRATPVFAPPGAGEFLARRGFIAVSELAPGESTRIGGLRIAAVEARHGHGRSPLFRHSQAVGFVVSGAKRVYFAGDTDLFEGMRALAGDLDLALLPVWGWGATLGPGHLDPERAGHAAAMLFPRIAVPIHWGTFFPLGLARIAPRHLNAPPRDFAHWCARLAPQVDVRILVPGEATSLTA